MSDARKCLACDRKLDPQNKSAVCNEECFYANIWNKIREHGLLANPKEIKP